MVCLPTTVLINALWLHKTGDPERLSHEQPIAFPHPHKHAGEKEDKSRNRLAGVQQQIDSIPSLLRTVLLTSPIFFCCPLLPPLGVPRTWFPPRDKAARLHTAIPSPRGMVILLMLGASQAGRLAGRSASLVPTFTSPPACSRDREILLSASQKNSIAATGAVGGGGWTARVRNATHVGREVGK